MSPQRMTGPAYWACGGGVEGRRGAVAITEAIGLLAFLAAEAEVHSRSGDAAAAQFCAEQAVELGRALARAVCWRRCGAAA